MRDEMEATSRRCCADARRRYLAIKDVLIDENVKLTEEISDLTDKYARVTDKYARAFDEKAKISDEIALLKRRLLEKESQ